MICYYCGRDEDTRPYGPGGAHVCLTCIKESPGREAIAGMNFNAILEATEAAGHGVSVIDTDGSLRPSDPEEREWLCGELQHCWVEEYYGHRCQNCGLFYPFDCAPWDEVL